MELTWKAAKIIHASAGAWTFLLDKKTFAKPFLTCESLVSDISANIGPFYFG